MINRMGVVNKEEGEPETKMEKECFLPGQRKTRENEEEEGAPHVSKKKRQEKKENNKLLSASKADCLAHCEYLLLR